MFHIAICEDCAYQMKTILCLLDLYQTGRTNIDIQSHSFNSGNTLLAALDAGNMYDLFLLDILMPGKNGIELAQEIRARDADVPLVFLTSSKDHALDAFGVSAVQYLVKPLITNELFFVLDKITDESKLANERFFMLSTPERIVRIPFTSITSAELSGRSVRIRQKNGNVLISKSIRLRFEDVIAPLLEDSRFLYPHKSFVINMAWVEELTRTSFVMRGGMHVPIPRYRYYEVKTKYFAWLAEQGIHMMGGGSTLTDAEELPGTADTTPGNS